eukprot:6212749-Amphidinium_carterae.3
MCRQDIALLCVLSASWNKTKLDVTIVLPAIQGAAKVLPILSMPETLVLRHAQLGLRPRQTSHRHIYASMDLIKTLLLAHDCCSTSSILHVLEIAVSIVYAALSACTKDLFKPQNHVVASPSTLSRTSLLLDCALALQDRETDSVQTRYMRYAMADSSPQHGNDWLLSLFDEVSVDMLIPCFKAVVYLRQEKADTVRASENQALLDTQIVRKHSIPQALGKQATTLADKQSFQLGQQACVYMVRGASRLGHIASIP